MCYNLSTPPRPTETVRVAQGLHPHQPPIHDPRSICGLSRHAATAGLAGRSPRWLDLPQYLYPEHRTVARPGIDALDASQLRGEGLDSWPASFSRAWRTEPGPRRHLCHDPADIPR